MSLDLACVKANAHLDSQPLRAIADCTGTVNRPSRSVEGQQKSVASRLDFFAT